MRMRTVVAGLLAATVPVVAAAPGAGPAAGAGPLVPQQRLCFDVAGEPGDVAVVNLTPVLAKGPGNGLLVSSDITAAAGGVERQLRSGFGRSERGVRADRV